MDAHIEPPPPADRYCDLVMKGGITSGVVYPAAIARLSRQYRFKNIGGTSAGAIAAAITAAAEYQRRQSKESSPAGFDDLQRLPAELKAKVPRFPHLFSFLDRVVPEGLKASVFGRRSRLLSLFQPQPATRRLFVVLESALNSGGTFRRIGNVIFGLLVAYWPATAVSLMLTLMVWVSQRDWLTTVLLALVSLVLFIGVWCYRDITKAVVDNGFGLSKGATAEGVPALTAWLHDKIQTAAGRTVDDDPLTFGDLWTANTPRDPKRDKSKTPDADADRDIDLRMFSTNLTHGRPYVFPLPRKPDAKSLFPVHDELYFKSGELAPYLPAPVMTWMRDRSTCHSGDFRELPAPGDVPILLAARMSLSFPFLISAVPLYAIDPRTDKGPRKCWFSDGGISSNFPMHLFDGLVPRWPTFGINLEPARDPEDPVFLPQNYKEGYGERWNTFFHDKEGNEKTDSTALFGGFIAAIVSAMQNWNDNMLSRMPGVRDRVARVPLTPNEGGMNLNMDDKIIQSVADKGLQAATLLEARFALRPAAGGEAEGWDTHRLVRLEMLLKMLEARAAGVSNGLDCDCPHTTDFDQLIDRAAASDLPEGHEAKLTAAEVAALKKVKNDLKQFMDTLKDPANTGAFRAIPAPELRVRPPL